MLLLALVLPAAAAHPPPLRADLRRVRPVRAALDWVLDPGGSTFTGVEDLDVAVIGSTREIRLNAAGLTIDGATAGDQPVTVTPDGDGWVALSFPKAVRGEVRVHLSFAGPVSDIETQGVFRQREGDDWYLFTEFEPLDARRAFPSFDQPDAKIPWTVTLHVPDDDQAFSNAPVRETVDEPGPLKKVAFLETKPLPTYLVAVAVGPFDVVDAGTVGRNQTPVQIVTPRGRSDWATRAAATTPPLLAALEGWFDWPYPFEKLDIVVLPQAVGFGAMENPGIITCVQEIALSRPEDDTPARQRDYAETIAHEMAHLWFGDLVTMTWWDDLWLNESFASWMGGKVVAGWRPDWNGDVQRVVRRNASMDSDSLVTARRIHEPIVTPDDVENGFDAITYGKGEAVLAMFERWLGEDTFQRGVRSYLRSHAYGNATATDFVDSMSEAAGRDLGPAFSGFLDQVGVPLVGVTIGADGVLGLTQQRYLPAGSSGKAKQRWEVPICVRWADDGGEHDACTSLSRREGEMTLPGVTGALKWVLPNAGEAGYYRVALDPAQVAVLLDPRTPLTLSERIGVLGDASAAVSAGTLDAAVVLDRLAPLVALQDPLVTGQTVGVVGELDAHLVPEDLRPNYVRMVHTLYGESATHLGLSSIPGEPEEERLLRPKVVGLVGITAQDPMILADALPLADRWLTDRTGVDNDMVDAVLGLAARDGDRALFDRVLAAATAEQDRERRGHLLNALGAFRDPSITVLALDAALSDTFDIRETFGLVFGTLSHRETRETAWTWVESHIDGIAKAVPTIARGYIPYLASGFCDAEHRAQAETFFRPRVGGWIGGARTLDQVLEGIDLCTASTARQEPSLRNVLASY